LHSASPYVLVVQHYPSADAGSLGDALVRQGLRLEIVRTDLGEMPPPELEDAVAFVSLGGMMFAGQQHEHPFLARERALFRDAIEREVPALGVCLGAQILALELGARVGRQYPTEVGWRRVRFTHGAEDPLTADLPAEATLFQWHYESFDLPDGATLLASSDSVPVHLFRAGSAWGLQSHLEAQLRHVEAWVEGADEELAAASTSPAELIADSRRHAPAQQAHAERAFGRFARLVAERTATLSADR
jgi:GMP synthase (glutamine-hydrolysing)